jgi:hypothetical protein
VTQSAPQICRRPSFLALVVLTCLGSLPPAAAAQANGQLQIHQIRVGQGDAALIVSPMGETMLIDAGPESASSCASSMGIITYLASIGLTHLDHDVASLRRGSHRLHGPHKYPLTIQVAAYHRNSCAWASFRGDDGRRSPTAALQISVSSRLEARSATRGHFDRLNACRRSTEGVQGSVVLHHTLHSRLTEAYGSSTIAPSNHNEPLALLSAPAATQIPLGKRGSHAEFGSSTRAVFNRNSPVCCTCVGIVVMLPIPISVRAQEPAVIKFEGPGTERLAAILQAVEDGLPYMPGEVLVRFKDGAQPREQAGALSVLNVDVKSDQARWIGDVLHITRFPELDPIRASEDLQRQSEVHNRTTFGRLIRFQTTRTTTSNGSWRPSTCRERGYQSRRTSRRISRGD